MQRKEKKYTEISEKEKKSKGKKRRKKEEIRVREKEEERGCQDGKKRKENK